MDTLKLRLQLSGSDFCTNSIPNIVQTGDKGRGTKRNLDLRYNLDNSLRQADGSVGKALASQMLRPKFRTPVQ